jgi:citrate lyase subunit beta/citryl-CoA lyase
MQKQTGGHPSGQVRPRRSVLFMPASNARALEKAQGLPADVLIFDLEDAVAPDAKDMARGQACAAAGSGLYGERELAIRANGLDTIWGVADVSAIATSGAAAVVLPKIESRAQIQAAKELLRQAGAPIAMKIWCMIETPMGILRVEEIAKTNSEEAADVENPVDCLIMGTSDLVTDLHARHTTQRLPVLSALSHCLLVARAYDLTILDGVHLDLDDLEGFEAACVQGLELGFDGKTLIHPKQLAIANQVYGPSGTEIATAKRIVTAFEAALVEQKALVVLDGKLIENLHVENAKRVLVLAQAIAQRQ